jgi:hypothetical protein
MSDEIAIITAFILFGASMMLLGSLMRIKRRKQPRDAKGRFTKFPD